MGKKRVNRNLRNSWNLDRHLSSETLSQNMDESERVDASLITHDYEGGFVDPFLATPSKSPPGKKKRDSNDVSLAEIFNAIQSINSKQDSVIQKITHIESSIEVTTAAVNSLSDTVNRLLSDVASHGEKIGKAESSIQHMQHENASLKLRVKELERYSRRWCLKLLGVKEREDENIRMTAISHLARVVPRIKDKLEEAVDVVHRVGKQRSDGAPRHVIIRFVTRRHRDIIWMEAKSSIYLRENSLHIKEFLSKADIESRNKLWPLVQAARKEGKKAGFSGPFAVINNKRIAANSAQYP
ncbi:cytoplasmic dynein 2 heavy chain 1-like protein [Labeo rohita]|uniref:Cytoplasmic dynein 2 heavy chain 1-like protein n=1 Tax=Labeo rohita TaxID=84645 RepID=A0A498N6H1_LABRO|nr:cytoplasmic dynein 2 heavy chain 1-like protein [Labeo rohita]